MDALQILFEIYNTSESGSNNQEIAKVIIENKETFAVSDINKVSELCHYSAATISRFCRKMGFESFAAFRKSLKDDLSGINRIEYVFSNSLSTSEDLVKSYSKQIQEVCTKYSDAIVEQDFKDLAEQMNKYKKIVIYMPTINSLYFNLQIDLSRKGKKVVACHDDRELIEKASQMDSDTFLLFFHNYLPKMINEETAAFNAHKKGAHIGVICNSVRSPILKIADKSICYNGTMYYLDNLFMDISCMLLSHIYRDLYLNN